MRETKVDPCLNTDHSNACPSLLSQFYYLLMTITLNIVRRSSDKKIIIFLWMVSSCLFLLSLYTLLFIRQQTTHTLLFFLQRLRWFSIEVITSVIFVFYSENTWKMRTILLYVDLFYFHASSSNENWLYCIYWKNKNKARGVDNVLYVQQSWHKIYNYDIW